MGNVFRVTVNCKNNINFTEECWDYEYMNKSTSLDLFTENGNVVGFPLSNIVRFEIERIDKK